MVIEHAPNRADGILKHLFECSSNLDLKVWKCYESSDPPTSSFDALVIGGGPMMVEDLVDGKFAFFQNEVEITRQAVAKNVPVWGICLGAQIIAYIYGGKVEHMDWVLGWHDVASTPDGQEDPIFMGVDVFKTFQLHRDHITELPSGANALATSPKSRFEAFRLHPNLSVWGSVFHPEVDIDQAKFIYDSVPSLFESNGVRRTDLSPSADGREQRSQLFTNFAKMI
jgi:GMP synthase-like glutamine amidotransferase